MHFHSDATEELDKVKDLSGSLKGKEETAKFTTDKHDSEVISETREEDIDQPTDGRPSEFHSMLSKQLSPSPASSESSSTQDEVSELPNVRRLRGHTISVITPAAKLVKATPITQGPSSESVRVGVPPSFVFLQLYHSGALNAGNDMPLLVPNNEVSISLLFP